MTKEEKIKEAYGGYWEDYKSFVSENGWLTELNDSIHHSVNGNSHYLKILNNKSNIEFEEKNNFLRPKSLQGIENNNGWVKIESENDLPKETGFFEFQKFPLVKYHPNYTYWHKDSTKIGRYVEDYSHYRPLKLENEPIY